MSWSRKHQLKIAVVPCEHRAGFVVVSCEGEYRTGSAGNPDAAAIQDYCRMVAHSPEVEGIILDYRELAYEWGDEIEGTLEVYEDETSLSYIPAVMVAGDHCRKALMSLLDDHYAIFCADTMVEAVLLLEQRIEEIAGGENHQRAGGDGDLR